MALLIDLASFWDASLLAQAGLDPGLGSIVRLLRRISYLLAVASLIISGIMFGTGRVEAAAYGVTAAGILGLAPSIVNFAFNETEGELDFPD